MFKISKRFLITIFFGALLLVFPNLTSLSLAFEVEGEQVECWWTDSEGNNHNSCEDEATTLIEGEQVSCWRVDSEGNISNSCDVEGPTSTGLEFTPLRPIPDLITNPNHRTVLTIWNSELVFFREALRTFSVETLFDCMDVDEENFAKRDCSSRLEQMVRNEWFSHQDAIIFNKAVLVAKNSVAAGEPSMEMTEENDMDDYVINAMFVNGGDWLKSVEYLLDLNDVSIGNIKPLDAFHYLNMFRIRFINAKQGIIRF